MRRTWIAVLATALVAEAALLAARRSSSVARAERDSVESIVPPALLARSRGFRELLAAVQQRGAELDRREQAVAAREAALQAIRSAIVEDVVRLEPPAGAPAPLTAPCGVAVAKVYQTMPSDEAAAILERLDDATATAILAGMKERQVGAILALMHRERAAALTKALATGR